MANIKITLLFAIGVLFGAPLFAFKNPSLDKTTKEVLKLHAIKNNLPEKDHLAALSNALFAKTGIAYQMLLDKIIRSICKTHLNELSTPIFFYTHVLQDIDDLMIGASKIAPASTKSLTNKKSLEHSASYTSALSSQPVIFLGFLTAFALIFIIWEQLEKNSNELALTQKRLFELNERVINQAKQINETIAKQDSIVDGFTSVLNVVEETLTNQKNLLNRFIAEFSKLTTSFCNFQQKEAEAASINELYARSFNPTIESIQKSKGIIQGWIDIIRGGKPPEPVIFEETIPLESIKYDTATPQQPQAAPATRQRPHATPDPFQTPPRTARLQFDATAPAGGSPGCGSTGPRQHRPQQPPQPDFSMGAEEEE
jgi:hypothetical protein